MKKISLMILGTIVFLGAITLFVRDASMRTILVGNEIVRVTIVDTPESRQQGLSGRSGLAADEGMLFVFPADGKYGFWMKDMLFSIDILWIAADGKIVHIAKNVSPTTFPQSFEPPIPARYVLELPSGYANAHQIEVGNIVRLES